MLLYGRGALPLFDEEAAIAVVGTRSCTPYGVAVAEEFGYEMAKQGALVVSGMARGIDAAAQRGALRAGGLTAAVLGGGVDVVYPAENRRLYEDIAAVGVLLSEYPPGTEPRSGHFPVRNRIMSGLTLASVVVEAPPRSGALITAHLALDQGRDVFAVPGPITAEASPRLQRTHPRGRGTRELCVGHPRRIRGTLSAAPAQDGREAPADAGGERAAAARFARAEAAGRRGRKSPPSPCWI